MEMNETTETASFVELDLNLNIFNIININLDDQGLEKLDKLNFNKFENGVVIFDLLGYEMYPILYLKKTFNSDILKYLIKEINEKIRTQHLNEELTILHSYVLVSTNVLVFKLK